MSLTNLNALFRPTSVAVIGASNDAKSPGSIVMRNLLAGHFLGPVMPVSRTQEAVSGVLTYKDVDTLPLTPDLAILAVPAVETPEYVARLGHRGAKAAVLLSPDFNDLGAEERGNLEDELLAAAKPHNLRLLGPGSMGLIAPGSGLNASLAQADAPQGRMAFVTQSDSLFATVLDWARASGLGFSHFVSLGDQLDVDFAAILDFLGADPLTRAILLYVESVCEARTFMSAARASARNKPILVLKPGQALPVPLARLVAEEECVVKTTGHEGADEVYDVAFRRAGIVRVGSVDNLFDGARTLAKSSPLFADGLAIVTNGRSVGLLTADACTKQDGVLATLADETASVLRSISGLEEIEAGLVNVKHNATGDDYAQVLKALFKDPSVAAVLVLHVPFAQVDSLAVAKAVMAAAKSTKRVVLPCWLGAESDRVSREAFQEGGLPHFESPDKAVAAYLHMLTYRRVQAMLMETPDSLPSDFFPDVDTARETIQTCLDDSRNELTQDEARALLTAYGVPVVESRTVVSTREAVLAAEDLGYPVALKVRSPQIEQPFAVGGVALDLETPDQVWDAAAFMVARVHKLAPEAYIDGFQVQQMGRRPGAHEVALGAEVDPVFGPVVRFGHGGMASDVIRDFAVALPPLNMSLARELVGRTRIARLLTVLPDGSDGGMDEDAKGVVDDICLTLIQISQLLIDHPQIASLTINPLFADSQGVLALGARISVARTSAQGPSRLAIRPYPKELEECVSLKGGLRVDLRPIRPEDAPAHFAFVKRLTPEDLRLRFFGAPKEFEYEDMASFTQIDYDREMAFIATREDPEAEGGRETVGVVRASTKPDNTSAEYAIIVQRDMQGVGLGRALLDKMIRYVKSRGTKVLEAQTLPENNHMIGLARRLGFDVRTDYEDEVVEMKLELNA